MATVERLPTIPKPVSNVIVMAAYLFLFAVICLNPDMKRMFIQRFGEHMAHACMAACYCFCATVMVVEIASPDFKKLSNRTAFYGYMIALAAFSFRELYQFINTT